MVAGVEVVDRLTIQTIDPDPRSTALLASAHLLGHPDVAHIHVADVYFVVGRLDDAVRRQLESILIDPLLQQGTWGVPADEPGVVEAALLPGVTDSVAATVLVAAATMELPVHQAATARRYVITGADATPAPTTVLQSLATELLSNAVIERVAVGVIDPVFLHASSPAPVELVEVRGLDDDQLAALEPQPRHGP